MKTNPNRKPATMADVNRAKREATDIAMKRMLMMFVYALKDMGVEDEVLDQVMDKFKHVVASISRGDIKWRDVEMALKDEYDIEIALH